MGNPAPWRSASMYDAPEPDPAPSRSAFMYDAPVPVMGKSPTPQPRDPYYEDQVHIKKEPQDDDDGDLFMKDDPPFANDDYPATSEPRPRDSEGEEFPTICFQPKYRDHPYKHRLICGHFIVTKTIEECGANCAPSRHAEPKPKTKAFHCPDPACDSKSQVAPQRKGRTIVKGRPCELSHIYGINQQEDAERADEKEKQAKSSIRSVAPKQRALYRKNSVSPPRRTFRGAATRSRVADGQKPIASTAESETDGMDEATHQFLQAMKGEKAAKEARRVRISQAETSKGSKTAAAAASRANRERKNLEDFLSAPSVDETPNQGDDDAPKSPPKASQSRKSKRKSGSRSGKFCDGDDGHVCDGCDRDIYGIRWSDKNCDDFDLCDSCFHQASEGEVKDHKAKCKFMKIILGNHDFELLHPRAQLDVDYDQQAVSCVCESLNREHMLDCEDCHLSFHPGCVGEVRLQPAQYDLPFPDNEALFEADWTHIQEHPIAVFKCLECKRREQGLLDQRKAKADVVKHAARSEAQQKKKKRAAAKQELDDLFGEEPTDADQSTIGDTAGPGDAMEVDAMEVDSEVNGKEVNGKEVDGKEVDGKESKHGVKRVKVNKHAPEVMPGGGRVMVLPMR